MQIHIRIVKEKVVLESRGWRPSLPDECKSIKGATWSKTTKTWSYPLSMNTLRFMREVFGDELVVDPALWEWAKVENRREKALKHHAAVHDAELFVLPKVAPQLSAAMATRTYQRSACRFAAVAGSFLLADDPGLGKTATALGALIESGKWHGDVLIIAPKSSLESVWARQIKMWTGNDNVVALPEGIPQRRKALDEFWAMQPVDQPRILVVNPAILRRKYEHFCKVCEAWVEDDKNKKLPYKFPLEHHLEEHSKNKVKRMVRPLKGQTEYPEVIDHAWTAVVLDESHQLLSSYRPSNIPQTTQGLLDLKTPTKYALTGTPLRGRETKIWGTLDWFGVKTGGYWGFVTEYFETANNGFGLEVHDVKPEKREALHAMLDRYVLRRSRAEVRGDLPMGQRIDVLVTMSAKQKKQYEDFKAWGEAELESGAISGQGVLSELTRMKQLAFGLWNNDGSGHLIPTGDSPKLEFMLEWLAARGVTGNKSTDWFPEKGSAYKYVIASQSTEILTAVELGLMKNGIPVKKITGAVTGARRTAAVQEFQSDNTDIRVMLIQTQTGGVAIELDAWCDEMMILDETWVADDQKQLEGRTDNRSGRVSPRSWTYVRTADTIEQTIAEGNWSQMNLQHELLDKRRGVEVALHLIKGDK